MPLKAGRESGAWKGAGGQHLYSGVTVHTPRGCMRNWHTVLLLLRLRLHQQTLLQCHPHALSMDALGRTSCSPVLHVLLVSS